MNTYLKRAALTSLIVALAVGCTDHRGTGPGPTNSHLYVAVKPGPPDYEEGYIHVIDCATDSIIDSISHGFTSEILLMSMSPDGRYLGVHPGGPPMVIWDLAAHSLAGTLSMYAGSFLFLPEESTMVVAQDDSSFLFSVPGFEPKGIWRTEFVEPLRIENTTRIIGMYATDNGGSSSLQGFRVFDWASQSVVDSFDIPPRETPGGFQPYSFALSPDGRRLYCLGGEIGGAWLVGYNLADHRVLFRYPNYSTGHCQATPDASEVWFTPGGAPCFFDQFPEVVTIVDARTGALRDTIPVHAATLDWPKRIFLHDIRFVPDGSKAYVQCGGDGAGVQPVLVIDTKSREILKIFYQDRLHFPVEIDMGPAL